MFFQRHPASDQVTSPRCLLISSDPEAATHLRPALAAAGRFQVDLVAETVERAEPRLAFEDAAVVAITLDEGQRSELLALQKLMTRIAGRVPVVVVTRGFDEQLARWLLQIRVTDFVKRPIDAADLAKTCLKAMQAQTISHKTNGEFFTFLPAAGGVGVTTLAVQTAFLLLRQDRKVSRTCLIDLDFQTGSCADHLDVEPRLALDEILPDPSRLDQHLLDMMISEHSSGLSVLAAPNRPAEMRTFDSAVVTRLLDLVSQQFDNVVIDMPRTWFPWTDDVLVGSDHVYIVTEMTVPGLRQARRLTGAIAARLGDAVKPLAIVNRFESSMFGSGLKRSDIEAALASTLVGCVSNNYKHVREAIDRGVPLEDIKSSSNVLADLRKIIAETRKDARKAA